MTLRSAARQPAAARKLAALALLRHGWSRALSRHHARHHGTAVWGPNRWLVQRPQGDSQRGIEPDVL